MMMALRSAVDVVIPWNAFDPLRQARGQRLRHNLHHFALHSAAFVAICEVRRKNFHKFSDRIGHVIRPASAVIHSSVAFIGVREPRHAAP
jgi:hypothetical protein